MLAHKLRVGLIGLGGIGRSEHLPHWLACPDADLVALCDVQKPALEQIGREFGISRLTTDWRELVAMPDLDVVDVATPNKWHATMTLAALAEGKHVLCEKPMATDIDDAEAMVELSRQSGKVLMVNQHLRFSPTLVGLRKIIGEGGLGTIYHVHAQWTRRRGMPTSPTFTRKENAFGGPIIDLGVHLLDAALWLMDFPRPTRVSATTGCWLAKDESLGGMWGDNWDRPNFEVEDTGIGLFHFEGGRTLYLHTNWISFQREPETKQLSLFGTKGGLHWPEAVYSSEMHRTPFDLELHRSPFEVPGPGQLEGKPHRRSIFEFAAAVRGGRPSPVPPEQSQLVCELILALYRSAASGREIRLDCPGNGCPHDTDSGPTKKL